MKSAIHLNSKNLIHNLGLFKAADRQKKLLFAVKANAYGHGLSEIIQITKDLPLVDYYGVDSLVEALIIKEQTEKNVLIMGWLDDQELEVAIRLRLEMVAPSIEFLKRAEVQAKKQGLQAGVHLKVETGTGRLGITPQGVKEFFQQDRYPHVHCQGIYSHFANIEDTTDHSYAQHQLKLFNNLLADIPASGLIKHFSCSASLLLFPQTHFDMMRVGISAYGYWPSKPTLASYLEKKGKDPINLKPVLSWSTHVAQVKKLTKNQFIGYGLTYKTLHPSRIITIPVGYYDGYSRKLSNLSNIITHDSKAPLRGRICMNMMMADVTHIENVSEGDPVLLLGQSDSETINADELAELSGSINYEILSRLNPLIPRIIA